MSGFRQSNRDGSQSNQSTPTLKVMIFLAITLCAFLFGREAMAEPQHDFAFVAAWGERGSQPGQFDQPAGIAVGAGGALYVADSANNRVQKLAPDGTVLAVWGGLGTQPGRLNRPWGIAVAGGRVYVGDRGNQRIQVFAEDGTFLSMWPVDGLPTGVATSNGKLYVSDEARHQVLVYSATGELLNSWGGYGSLGGQFFLPSGIAVAGDGSVYVVDRGNHRIQRLSGRGQFLRTLGDYGDKCWQFDRPTFVAVLPSGNLAVSDQRPRLAELTPTGGCVTWWGLSGPGRVQAPLGVAVTGTGRVYVADSAADRIMVYMYQDLVVRPRAYLPVVLKAHRPLKEVRVNAGGGSYLDSQNRWWFADQQYRTGEWGYIERASSIYATDMPIAGAPDQALYQTERYSMSGYAFDVPVGYYEVVLKFAEIFYDRPGQRIFSVRLEGTEVITDLDIFAEAGRNRAHDRVFALPIVDGQLNIDFFPKRFNDAPKISAIAVRQLSDSTQVTPTPTPPTEYKVTFTQGVAGYRGTRDTFIDVYSPTANMEGLQYLAVRPYREDQGRASLIYFDVSSIPANSTILEANLTIHVADRTNANALYVGAYRLLRPWSITQTTWISASETTAWEVAGALGATDRANEAEDALAIDTPNTWYTFTLTSLVQSWLNAPSQNYGIILQSSPGPGAVEYKVRASESFREEFRPRLTVRYIRQSQPITVTPTPSAPPTFTPIATRTPTATSTPTPTPVPSVTVVVLQQGNAGYSGVQDTVLYAWNPTTNHGNDWGLYVRANDYQATLMRFDVSSIPADADVEQATLSLYSYASSNPNLLVADVFAVLRPWVVTEATWISATQAITWAVPGCNGLNVDRSATIVDVQGVDSFGHWYTFTVTSLVQQWVRQPQDNFGLVIKGREGSQVQYSFRSSEAPQQAQRPFLTITYRQPRTHIATLMAKPHATPSDERGDR